MEMFSVDMDACTHCGQCVLACGRLALVDDGKGGPDLPEANLNLCNACGHCSAVCPVGAVVSPKCGGKKAAPYPDASDITFTEAERFLLSCRSMRRYKQEAVQKEVVLDILDVARKAPSASNSQPISWAILSGREMAQRFTALTMEWFDTVVRNDPERNSLYNIDRLMAQYKGGYDAILRGAPNAVLALTDKKAGWGATDAAIALTYFCLAAHARGVGSCWAGFGMRALQEYKPLRDLMGLGDDLTVHGMAFFGYPELSYHAVPPRKDLRVRWIP